MTLPPKQRYRELPAKALVWWAEMPDLLTLFGSWFENSHKVFNTPEQLQTLLVEHLNAPTVTVRRDNGWLNIYICIDKARSGWIAYALPSHGCGRSDVPPRRRPATPDYVTGCITLFGPPWAAVGKKGNPDRWIGKSRSMVAYPGSEPEILNAGFGFFLFFLRPCLVVHVCTLTAFRLGYMFVSTGRRYSQCSRYWFWISDHLDGNKNKKLFELFVFKTVTLPNRTVICPHDFIVF